MLVEGAIDQIALVWDNHRFGFCLNASVKASVPWCWDSQPRRCPGACGHGVAVFGGASLHVPALGRIAVRGCAGADDFGWAIAAAGKMMAGQFLGLCLFPPSCSTVGCQISPGRRYEMGFKIEVKAHPQMRPRIGGQSVESPVPCLCRDF